MTTSKVFFFIICKKADPANTLYNLSLKDIDSGINSEKVI